MLHTIVFKFDPVIMMDPVTSRAAQWRLEVLLRGSSLQGRGPHTAGGHGCNRHVGWQELEPEQQETELRGPARNWS